VEAAAGGDAELGFFKLRYKLPKEEESKLISASIGDAQAVEKLAAAPDDVRFSVAVAAFGQLLKGAPYLGSFGYNDVVALAQGARGDDPFGYRSEFVNLVRLAKTARP
jgi:Ca-activated chloride channel family protein